MPLPFDERSQRACEHASDLGPVEQRRQHRREQPPRATVRHRPQQPGNRARHRRHQRRPDFGLRQQPPNLSRQIEPRHQPQHFTLGENLVGDEIAERLAEPCLLARDHRRVRDRQSEWPAKQRRHREPIRDPADEARPRARAKHVEPAPVRQPQTAHRGRRHRQEQPGGEPPMARKTAPERRVMVDRAHALPLTGQRLDCNHSAIASSR